MLVRGVLLARNLTLHRHALTGPRAKVRVRSVKRLDRRALLAMGSAALPTALAGCLRERGSVMSQGAQGDAARVIVPRPLAEVVPSERVTEGAGFVVRRPFPTMRRAMADPFLLLDHLGPVAYWPGQAMGAPDHPHRGFETISYLLDGEIEHEDSRGNVGRLHPGDLQWMTAGQGIVHSEMPGRRLRERGGLVHGFQIWVNLPASQKWVAPGYQDLRAAAVPLAERPDGARVRVIAGRLYGVEGAVRTRTPVSLAHVTLARGARFAEALPDDHATAFFYVIEGRGVFGAERREAREGDMVSFAAAQTGHLLAEQQGAQALELLLLGARPLREPVARYGPFVMNTSDEIAQAFSDYRAGRLGRINRRIADAEG